MCNCRIISQLGCCVGFLCEKRIKIIAEKFGGKEKMSTFAIPNEKNGSPNAEIAQLVEHNLAKVGVASSSLVFRSKTKEVSSNADLLFETKSQTY